MDSFRDVIDRWPDGRMAADLQIEGALVRSWRNRNSIPPDYWPVVAEKAKARGFKAVTIERLSALRRPRKRRAS